MGALTHQNPKFRIADLPRDGLERFSDAGKVIRFDGSCQFKLNPRARKGTVALLVQDQPGQVQLVPDGAATLLERDGGDTLGGADTMATLMVTDNPNERSAKYMLTGSKRAYNDTTPWADQTLVQNGWFGACWSPALGLFVLVASQADTLGTDDVATSPDGVTWTTHSSGIAFSWIDVEWSESLGLFVAVGSTFPATANAIMTSPDGVTWTQQTTPVMRLHCVCWSPELALFVAAGVGGSGVTAYILTSTNGVDWVTRDLPDGLTYIGSEDICWSRELGLFLLVGDDYDGFGDILLSPNGVDWENVNTPDNPHGTLEGFGGCCWAKELGLFVIASDGWPQVYTSPNGRNWTVHTIPDENAGLWRVKWSAELGILLVQNYINATGHALYWSTDGIHWYTVEATLNYRVSDLVWSPELGIFVHVSFAEDPAVQTSNPL